MFMRVILKVLVLGLLGVAGVRCDDGVHVVVAPEEGLLELCPVKNGFNYRKPKIFWSWLEPILQRKGRGPLLRLSRVSTSKRLNKLGSFD